MKTLLQILFYFILFERTIFPDWFTQFNGLNFSFFCSIDFVNPEIGWAVGYDAGNNFQGKIFKTVDGGATWMIQESNPIPTLRGVSFINVSTGIAVGDAGTIITTTDGGSNWITRNSGTSVNLNSIYLIDANLGWAAGGNATIVKTTNGGLDWIVQNIDTAGNLNSIFFIDNNIGWAVGDSGLILSTLDGGVIWNRQISGTYYYNLRSVYFINSNIGWAVGHAGEFNEYGIILKTTNGGLEWNNITPLAGIWGLTSIKFLNETRGFAVGFCFIYSTTDGGFNWSEADYPTYRYLNDLQSIDIINDTICFAAGYDNTILKSINGGIYWIDLMRIDGEFTSFFFVDNNNGWVIGSEGGIAKTDNNGNTWISQISNTYMRLNSVYFINDSLGWITGNNGIILKTTNGGRVWNPQISGTPFNLRDIYFLNSMYGIVVGDEVTILKTSDGGTHWSRRIVGGGVVGNLYGITLIDTTNGVIVGEGGLVLKTINAGENWSRIPSGTTEDIYSLVFTDSNFGTAVGNSGTIIRTTDGGSNWFSQFNGTSYDLLRVTFIDNNNGWALGIIPFPIPIIFRTTNGGENWISQEMYDWGYQSVTSILFKDLNNGWVLGWSFYYNTYGKYGLIYRTTNGGVSIVEEEQIDEMPTEFLLSQNYPNPFNSSTNIKYSVPQASQVQIKVFDVLGNEIEKLVEEEKPVGTYEVTWHAANLPSGVYFYQLKAGEFISTKKMILLK